MDDIWNKMKEIAENNNGYIRTSQVEASSISRPMLKKYTDMGKLECVRKGLYILTDAIADEYVLLQARSAQVIYSYGTALYFWDMSDRVPHIIDITVQQGANVSKLFHDNDHIRCHYVQPDIYKLGITETKSPQGGVIKLYDKERCICDLIRDKDKMDMQLFSEALKTYFKNKPNNRKLLKYGKIFGIEDKIRTYMEVL